MLFCYLDLIVKSLCHIRRKWTKLVLTCTLNRVQLKVVKKRDLEDKLKALGWWLLREGGNHEVWTNGLQTQAIPRHREINEWTARAIIKFAAAHLPEGDSK